MTMKKNLNYLIGFLAIIIVVGCFNKRSEDYRPGSVPETAIWDDEVKRWAELKDDGKLYLWYDTGEKNSISERKDGVANGKDTTWYKNGKIKCIMYHINGKRNGAFKSWWENGNIQNISTYVNGKRHGLFQDFDENGNLQVEEQYSNDVLMSKKIIGTPPRPSTVPMRADYDFKRKLWQTIDFDNICNCSRVKRWFQSGRIEAEGIINKDDLQNGQWVYNHENGRIKFIITYNNGVKDGPSVCYREDGSKSRTVIYKDGKEVKTEK